MEQIRNTMLQHEALFREQVQALHKLYNIQKSAMQERQKQIYSQAQFLAFSSEKLAFAEGQISGSVLEGKPLRPAYASVVADREESLALSLQPFCAMDGFKGCGSLWTDSRGHKTSHTAQGKLTRNFDLERLPEEYMDESEIQVTSKCSDMLGANSTLSKGTPYKDENSFLKSNFSFSQVDSLSSKQMHEESNSIVLLDLRKETNQDGDESSDGKVDSTNIKKMATVFQNMDNTPDSTIRYDFQDKNMLRVGNFHACLDLSPPDKSHMDKQISLHQQGLLFPMTKGLNPVESKRVNLEKTTVQASDNTVLVLNQLNQLLESESLVATMCLKSGEQLNDRICGASVSKNPHSFSVCSSTLAPVPNETKDLENSLVQASLSSETNSHSGKQTSHPFSLTILPKSKDDGNAKSNDLGTESSNGSGNGSNSVHSQESRDIKSSEDDKNSMHVKNTPEFVNGYSQAGHSNQGRGEATEYKLDKLPLTEDGGKTPFSATSDLEHRDSCSNDDRTIIKDSNKHLVRLISEELKDKSTLEIVRENIAAEILLSFAPCRADRKLHGAQIAQIETETGRASGGNSISDKKWNLRERRYTNYSSSNNGINESMRWTKSVHRTRTSRKPR